MPASRLRRLLAVALLPSLAPAAAPAQGPLTITGIVVDTAGRPVPGQQVLLHRVAGQDGARLAEAESGADGAFRFQLEEAPADSALYFATARFAGQVYIGDFLRPPIDPAVPYRLVVGGEPVSFDAPMMPAGGAPPVRMPARGRRWALAVIPAVALLGAAFVFLSRRGQQSRRMLLVRLAALEEEAGRNGETDAIRQERTRILAELSGRASG